MSGPSTTTDAPPLARLDLQHLWHPFTPMRQWRQTDPLIIERGQGPYLIDTQGRRYIDGVSSLWCNVHGHRVPAIDQAVRDQLDKIAHTTLLGLASPPSIELAARLCAIAPGGPESSAPSPKSQASSLNKVFYSDAGATALEVAFKMAVGYWHHQGRPQKHKFIGLAGAYHGDTTGSMSVGYSELFHRPFRSMVFPTYWAPVPDACRPFAECRARLGTSPERKRGVFPSEDEMLNAALCDHCLSELESLLQQHAHETAAIVI
ncbi:MAG: aminotransferase class III-fold pyridoxal phosphate-dependent enzyme, partial [Phycisphaeraceae bacterium]